MAKQKTLHELLGVPEHIPIPEWVSSSPLINPKAKPRKPTRGERVIMFIEQYCRVPEGKLVGQPIRLEPFQIGRAHV